MIIMCPALIYNLQKWNWRSEKPVCLDSSTDEVNGFINIYVLSKRDSTEQRSLCNEDVDMVYLQGIGLCGT